jgi:hypothetical protein
MNRSTRLREEKVEWLVVTNVPFWIDCFERIFDDLFDAPIFRTLRRSLPKRPEKLHPLGLSRSRRRLL